LLDTYRYGEGEWLEEKHGKRSRRRWRKLHHAIDANSHDVVAVELTSDEVGDVTAVPDLLATGCGFSSSSDLSVSFWNYGIFGTNA
jgi:hypothetical protein